MSKGACAGVLRRKHTQCKKSHAMQGSSLPDAAAAAAFNSSAAAHRTNTASASRRSKAAIGAGRARPAKEVRHRNPRPQRRQKNLVSSLGRVLGTQNAVTSAHWERCSGLQRCKCARAGLAGRVPRAVSN